MTDYYTCRRCDGDRRYCTCHMAAKPSHEPKPVVTQDLVEQIARALQASEPHYSAWDDMDVECQQSVLTAARAILPILEAAQIAARNEALDEVHDALCDDDKISSPHALTASEHSAFHDGLDVAAAIVRALRQGNEQ